MKRIVEDGDVRPRGIQHAELRQAAGAVDMWQQVVEEMLLSVAWRSS